MTDKERFYDVKNLNNDADELNYVKEVVKTIAEQVSYNKMIFGSWGSHKFSLGETNDDKPFFEFVVNGFKFRGYVRILYNAADYYEVEFYSTHKNLKHRLDEVYCDELETKIDEFVEKQDDYIY